MPPSPPEFVTTADLGKAKPGVIDEIIRQGEARMQAQLQSALAADARAGVLASVQGAASAALFVLAFQDSTTQAGVWSAVAAGLLLAIGCGFAVAALQPVDFGFVGTRPNDWKGDLASGTALDQARLDTARHLDKYLVANDQIMERNNGFAKIALRLLAAAPIAAMAGFVTYAYLHR